MATIGIQTEDPVGELARAIVKKLEADAEATIREAVAAYETKLRDAIGSAILQAASHYSMAYRGNTLEIRVDIEDRRSK